MNSQISEIISAFSELKNWIIILIKKKIMIWNIFFLIIWKNIMKIIFIMTEKWYKQINTHKVQKAFFCQSIKKTSDLNRINFWMLRMLWNWNTFWITALIKHCIRLEIHFFFWKVAKKIILKKFNKSDYFIVNVYQMITLLSCTDKIIKKLTANVITTYYEVNNILHTN